MEWWNYPALLLVISSCCFFGLIGYCINLKFLCSLPIFRKYSDFATAFHISAIVLSSMVGYLDSLKYILCLMWHHEIYSSKFIFSTEHSYLSTYNVIDHFAGLFCMWSLKAFIRSTCILFLAMFYVSFILLSVNWPFFTKAGMFRVTPLGKMLFIRNPLLAGITSPGSNIQNVWLLNNCFVWKWYWGHLCRCM